MPSLPVSLLAAALAVSSTAAVAVFTSASAAVEPAGHLILQVEGDANALRVTRITPKPDPCGLARFTSDYAIVVRDAQRTELGRVPLDLSAFDLDPSRVGQSLRLEGCVVRDPRVAMLANVPRWPSAAAIEIVHGERLLGSVPADQYQALIQTGERR